MARTPLLILLLSAATMVTGCAQDANSDLTARNNPTVYSVHQPVVQRTDYVLDLTSTGNGLAPAESVRLKGWFDGLQLGYGDRISIDESGGYIDPSARAEIQGVAGAYGMLLSEGAPITAGAVEPGRVRVVVSRMSASVPGCPDWSYSGQIGAPISTDSNYGCATNSNLAAMVADPNDLVLGQSGGSAVDAADALKAVKTYRDRVQTGFDSKLATEKRED